MNVNRQLLAKFKNKWKTIEQIENKELMNMSIREKFLKTLSIMQLGFGLGYRIDTETIKDIEKVRLRWSALKNTVK